MNNQIFYAELNDNHIVGYYLEEYHGIDKCNSLTDYIRVNNELHNYLLTLNDVSFNGIRKNEIYTIEDKLNFSQIKPKESKNVEIFNNDNIINTLLKQQEEINELKKIINNNLGK